MPVITPPVVDAIDPTKIPQRSQDPATFTANADYTVGKWPEFQTEINAVASNVNNNATEAFNAATSATASQTAAATSATNAASSATAASTSATNAANSAATAATNTVLNRYVFSTTTTMADPTAGNVRFNNATLSSVTAIAIDAQTADSGNPNILNWLLTFDDSTNSVKGQIIFREIGTPTDFAIYNVTGLTNNTGWVQLAVTHVASSGSFADGVALSFSFERAGDKGLDGGVASINGLTGVLTGFVTETGTQTLTNKIITGLDETHVAIPASNIDLNAGNYFSKNISGATTFTLSNVPASDTVTAFVLELTNGGSATVTWWSGVKWAGGTAPTLTSAGVDILGFYSRDGGTTYRGMLLAKDSK